MTFSDAFGTWTHDNEVVQHDGPGGDSPTTSTRTGSYLTTQSYYWITSPFPAAGSWDGGFAVQFGCYTMISQCLGLRTIEIDLGFEILGFGGHLDYYKGYEGYLNPDYPHIPLLRDAFSGPPGLHPYSNEPSHQFFNGFFGVIFDQPTSVIRLAWREDTDADDSSSVRFTNTWVITAVSVPEPGALAVLAAGLLGLAAIGQTTRATAIHRRRR